MATGRTLVYKLMVAAPLIFTMGLGVSSRTNPLEFEFVEATPTQNAEIAAYIPLVRASLPMKDRGPNRPSVEETRRVARMWIDASARQEIKPLTPVAYEDSTRDGVKADIKFSNRATADLLNLHAYDEIRLGKLAAGVEDALTAAETVDILRYSDFSALTTAGMTQRRSVFLVRQTLPKLAPDQQKDALVRLSKLRTQEKRLRQMLGLARAQFVDFQFRQRGAVNYLVEAAHPTLGEGEGHNQAIRLRNQAIRGMTASLNSVSPTLMFDVSLATMSSFETDSRIDQTLREFRSVL